MPQPGVPRAAGNIGAILMLHPSHRVQTNCPVLRHLNKDPVIPELQLLKRLYRLMVKTMGEAVDYQHLFAGGSSVAMVFVGSPRD